MTATATTATHDTMPPSTKPSPVAPRRYDIVHQTRFTYSAPISLGQLVVRLQPRTSFDQRLINFSIRCDPLPARHTHCLDLHGNIRHWFWFEKQHSGLTLITRSIVDCLVEHPFDFIVVEPGVESLPATYDEPVRSATAHYRHRPTPHPIVDALARHIRQECNGHTVHFLSDLARHLREHIQHIVRPSGEPWSPTKTLERGEGACRDTTMLYIDACRAVGLAARFVSGYAFDATDDSHREMHAWAEVYLPGAGWRGYDPTTGHAVSNRHIAVAASPTAGYAAPTTCTFTGPKVNSTLNYDISMNVTEAEPAHAEQQNVYTWPPTI